MRKIVILLMLFFSCTFSFGEVPSRTEELIYSIVAFTGNDYTVTFAKEDVGSIYLYADTDNFLSMKKNFLYYWPIKDEWVIDDSVLDVTFGGVMEITDKKGVSQQIEAIDYTYFNMQGVYDNNWYVKTGEDATAEWNLYVQMSRDYQEALAAYNYNYDLYKEATTVLLNEILRAQEKGDDQGALLAQLATYIPPLEPEEPKRYTVPPVKIQHGFRIKLPEGTYTLRFLCQDGKLLQDSVKNIYATAPRRTSSIGYEIFPADRWTIPSESTFPSFIKLLT